MRSESNSRFQEILVKEKLTSKKQVPYYALWVNKFLSFSGETSKENFDDILKQFPPTAGLESRRLAATSS